MIALKILLKQTVTEIPIVTPTTPINQMHAAYAFLASLLLGTVLGYMVDRRMRTTPMGLLVGAGLGFSVGLAALWQALREKSR